MPGTEPLSPIELMRMAGAEQQDYLTVTLEDVLISSCNPSSDETPTESISFNFSKIEWEG